MIIEYLEDVSSISFFYPFLPNGGIIIDNCIDFVEAKNIMLQYFQNLGLTVTLTKVARETPFFIHGVNT